MGWIKFVDSLHLFTLVNAGHMRFNRIGSYQDCYFWLSAFGCLFWTSCLSFFVLPLVSCVSCLTRIWDFCQHPLCCYISFDFCISPSTLDLNLVCQRKASHPWSLEDHSSFLLVGTVYAIPFLMLILIFTIFGGNFLSYFCVLCPT